MSTLPPSIQSQTPDKALITSLKMATAKTSKVKSTSSKTDTNGTPKTKTQMHRRSRSGCYTCRLRRKKCDEGTPFCTACQHLGLECQYKRPLWWGNNEARRHNKEDIKIIIKRKKLAEKASAHAIHASVSPPPPPPPPPSLTHSLPTSLSGPGSGSDFYDHDRDRSSSIDSHASACAPVIFNFNSPPNGPDFVACNPPQIHPDFVYAAVAAGCSPYEIDVKTERQMFVNDVPTIRESHISTFSTAHTPPPPGTVLPAGSYPDANWAWHWPSSGSDEDEADQEHPAGQDEVCRRPCSLSEEALNVSFFDFAHGPPQESRQVRLELDDNDQRLLEHFIQFVLPTIFPILESNQHGCVSSDLILPALQSNSIYLHCCLSIAAQHIKAIGVADGGDIDDDIMRHRYATIWLLCQALSRDENHQQILEATLGLIFYQCIVGHTEDGLLDIAWHQHFQAAVSLVQKLDLPRLVSDDAAEPMAQTPFNMTLTAWIDILGASMLGQSPAFAHTYREKHLSQNSQLGLRELMGCEDRVMYLISEIACLESLKNSGMDDFVLCQHVSSLGEQISMTEDGDWTPRLPFNANGSLSPKQLCRNITAAFRIAARIYLCSLVPGFSPSQPSPMTLVEKLTAVLQCIPAGTGASSEPGYDRSLVWVYLIGGSISGADSPFRGLLEERVAGLGEQAKCGSFGRMVSVLRETWSQNDQMMQGNTTPMSTGSGSGSGSSSDGTATAPHVHWRDVMRASGWDYLLL